MSEFELIRRYFSTGTVNQNEIALGIGDDCALLQARAGMQLAISTDMLVAGRHFFAAHDARQLGHKALAVNFSDLAAMGAQPLAFTLALALPAIDEDWLAGFSAGLFALADRHSCQLIGGDTTRGPLTICITVFGELPIGAALRRDGARVGDEIWVSGALGDARLGLAGLNGEVQLNADDLYTACSALHKPQPRVALGLALRGVANAAIDLSDGLRGDLGHILQRSTVGATLQLAALPIGPMLAKQALALQADYALGGGDDYELCFTAAPMQRNAVLAAAASTAINVTCIGHIDAEPGLRVLGRDGKPLPQLAQSFDHFLNS